MFEPGQTIGRFRVIERLGAGGMGEVWKATDTSLDRPVALKSLPAAFAQNPDRAARFEHEARLLASLSHPNIAAIYGFDRSEGAGLLELELVEGQPLDEYLGEGLPPLDQSLDIARQIADALGAAHRQGIMHRDLKPSNVMLKADGSIKVLDFGLAKTFAEANAAAAPTQATVSMTQEGRVLGTPAYMSPEQARGERVDARTDIWAFGCLLFEMLTGASPFAQATPTETLSKVLEREPDLDALPAATPASVRRLLRRCLVKDPRQRLQHIGDARLDILEALERGAPHATRDPMTAPRRPWRAWGLAGSLVTLVGISTFTVWLLAFRTGSTPALSLETFPVGPSLPAELIISGNRMVAITPDSSLIAISSGGSLSLRAPGRQSAQEILAQDARHPFFSSNGEWLGFITGGELMKASVFDGVPLRITAWDALGTGRFLGGTWHQDTIVFALQGGVYRIAADGQGAEPELVQATPKDRTLAWPEFLPGGKTVLVTVLAGNSIEHAYTALLDLETGQLGAPLVRGIGARYAPAAEGESGYLAYVTPSGGLAARPFDTATLEVGPVPAAIPEVEVHVKGTYLAAAFDLADDATLIHIDSYQTRGAYLSWFDRDGAEERIDAELPITHAYPRLSPAGDRVVLDIGVGTPNRRIWTLELATGILTQLSDSGETGPVYEDFQGLWGLDGERVYFASTRTGRMEIWSRAADGSGRDVSYAYDPEMRVPLAAAPGDRLLVMRGAYQTADFGILAADSNVDWLMETPFSEVTPVLSPDGNWIAYSSNRDGEYAIYVASFPSGANERRISSRPGRYPLWRRGVGDELGDELYFIGRDDFGEAAMISVTLDLSGSSAAVVDEQVLFRREFLKPWTEALALRPYDISVDGRILFHRVDTEAPAPMMTIWLTRNWTDAVAP